ncbi:MAG TPA: DUF4402 domain-containing protein [Alphaproteobacteria bacterium]|nr:DUF4402 domain-containing protein [Alphaproteobacteria bacterium]
MPFSQSIRFATLAAVTLGVGVFAQSAQAQISQSANGTVNVTVDNNITITPVDPMDFGTVAAVAAVGETATLVIDTADSMTPTNTANAGFYPDGVTIPTSATFNVEGPIGVNLDITLPAAPVAVDQSGGCVGTAPDFTLDTFVSNPTPTVAGLGTGNPTLVAVGATLKTDPGVVGTVAYESCLHTGTFVFTVGF